QHSGVRLRFCFADLPFHPGARRYADEMLFPGGANRNRDAFAPHVTFRGDLDPETRLLLFTPETSGGLLIALPPDVLDAFLARCQEEGQPAWVVGDAVEGEGVEVVAGG
ncbi:MAG: selenide, water dikinase SelD, partial [Anaerolineae bacterium]|nr:selenide, water dikinase SelD [Anaerolineae bacterium]